MKNKKNYSKVKEIPGTKTMGKSGIIAIGSEEGYTLTYCGAVLTDVKFKNTNQAWGWLEHNKWQIMPLMGAILAMEMMKRKNEDKTE